MHSLYFLLTKNFNEKLNQNYKPQNLHKHEGERNIKERNMHSLDILEEDERNKKTLKRWKKNVKLGFWIKFNKNNFNHPVEII